MNIESQSSCRYFVSYSGVKLPLKPCQPLEEESLSNRNTFFQAWFDGQDRITVIRKMVYGEVEMEHHYSYYADGKLEWAEVTDADGNVTVVSFDESGAVQQ